MKITLTHRDGSKKTWDVESKNLYDAIYDVLEITQKEDDTGYFFDVQDASEEYLRDVNVVIFDKVGIDLRNVSVESEEMIDANVFRNKVVNNMKKIVELMNEIEKLNYELVDKYDAFDAGYFFNMYLPCGGNGYPFNLSFDEQIWAIDDWAEQIEDMIKESNNEAI